MEYIRIFTVGEELPPIDGATAVDSPWAATPPCVVVVDASRCPSPAHTPPPDLLLILLGEHVPDGVEPHLLLPERPPAEVLARAVEAARDHLLRKLELQLAMEDLMDQRRLRRELLEVGTALSAETDLGRLLERILGSARKLVRADAGSLYLRQEEASGEEYLYFAVAQNASMPMTSSQVSIPLDTTSIAGMVATTGKPLLIPDAYAIPESAPYAFNPSFDEASGYRTRSILAVPMTNRAGRLVGVLQLINRKRNMEALLRDPSDMEREVIPFTARDRDLLRALASQAAVVVENTRLVEEIQELFESFVQASVTAIEQRDPPTSGHSARVADYTLGLAVALERSPPPAYRGITFSADEIRQLRYAALLHDVGKLGVRERVLTKEGKLYPYQDELVRERFHHARRAIQLAAVRRRFEELVGAGRPPAAGDLEELERLLRSIDAEFDEAIDVIEALARPSMDGQRWSAALEELARRHFPGPRGEPLPLLLPDELHLLSIPRGNLDDEERREVQSHVIHSRRFLVTLPWPSHLARVPEIAALHHEKLNGRGYPGGVSGDAIPVEVRMLTIADIYDALTASDRPYKPSLPAERALEVLEEEVFEGALDPHLVSVFIEAGVYRSVVGSPAGIPAATPGS